MTHTITNQSASGFEWAKISDMYLYSCYAPPGRTLSEFKDILHNLFFMQEDGNFNPWTHKWGSRKAVAHLSAPFEKKVCLVCFISWQVKLLPLQSPSNYFHTIERATRRSIPKAEKDIRLDYKSIERANLHRVEWWQSTKAGDDSDMTMKVMHVSSGRPNCC